MMLNNLIKGAYQIYLHKGTLAMHGKTLTIDTLAMHDKTLILPI